MRAGVVIAVLLLLGAPHAAAQTGPPVAIVDAEAPLAVPAPVRVLNNTTEPLTVEVAATAQAQDRTSAVLEVRRGAQVVTTVEVPASGDVWLAVERVGTAPGVAVSGYFVVTAGAWVVRRPITVAAPARAAIVPAVASWETSWAPLLPDDGESELPGRVPAPGCPNDATQAGTVVSGHDTAAIKARCVDGGLVLTMTGAPSSWPSLGVGEYSGTLTFGDKALAVTVDRSGSVLAALGWLLAGIAAAVAGATYTADRRPFNDRKSAIDGIKAPEGTLKTAVDAAKGTLTTALTRTRPKFFRRLLPWPDGYKADAVKAVDEDTARLREAAGSTARYDAGIAALAAHQTELDLWMPGMATRFAELTTPLPTDARALADRVADAAAIPSLVDLAARVRRMTEAVESDVPRSRDRHAARAVVRQLTARLGRLARPVEAADLRADVEAAQAAVDRLGVTTFGAQGLAIPGGVLETIQKVLGGTGKTAMVVRDGAAAAVVAVLALWTGFAALYVAADTWGTLWDVLTAITWGAAATAVSGPLLTAFRRVGSSRQPGD